MIKTIKSYNPDIFDSMVNEFCAENDVFATQTHVFVENEVVTYIAVLFVRAKPKV